MSERHVRRLIASKELPTHKFGKAVRIALSDVLVFEARSRSDL
jgi:excisionase family DNA binding protein